MRRLLFLPVIAALLLGSLACGSSRLSQREATQDIRQDYPIPVILHVPARGKATPGTKEFQRLSALKEALGRKGWFKVDQHTEGTLETFAFSPATSLPSSFKTTGKGWEIPAAQAAFDQVLRVETRGSQARVTYRVRLEKPTEYFYLFQAANPDVHVGDTKERHAMYRRERRDWVLQSTDEVLRKEP